MKDTHPQEALLKQREALCRFSRIRKVGWDEIEGFCERTAREISGKYDMIIGILRYGAPVATLLSRHCGITLDFIVLSNTYPEPLWLGDAKEFPCGKRILIVDDTVATGFTFERASALFAAQRNTVATLSMFYTEEWYRPDYGMPLDKDTYILWPWHYGEDRFLPQDAPVEEQARKYGSDLDGVFLADIAAEDYIKDADDAVKRRAMLAPFDASLHPPRGKDSWHIVSGRPEHERAASEDWLKRNEVTYDTLLLRNCTDYAFGPDDNAAGKLIKSALSKAAHIKKAGITHFYESDASQAILIASELPEVHVYWWDTASGMRKRVRASDAV